MATVVQKIEIRRYVCQAFLMIELRAHELWLLVLKNAEQRPEGAAAA
jgi:hypothetical protein